MGLLVVNTGIVKVSFDVEVVVNMVFDLDVVVDLDVAKLTVFS